MAASKDALIRVSTPFEQTVPLVQSALQSMGVTVSQVDAAHGTLLAKTGVSIKSFGENITVRIAPADHGSDINIHSECLTQMVDWGANADNINRFTKALEALHIVLPAAEPHLPKNPPRDSSAPPRLPVKRPDPEPIEAEHSEHGRAGSSQQGGASVIKVLFLASNPTDTPSLRLDQEMRAIDQAIRQAEFRDRFELEQQWAVRVLEIQGSLLRYKPDIVHFSGHGSPASEIIFEDQAGRSSPVSARALSQLFSVLKDNIRCVVLNACYSEKQARAIAQQIDCVVGMSKEIGDSAAIDFAAAFYQALGYGRDVKTAFDLGCVQIDLAGLDEQATPKLLATKTDPKRIVFV